MLNAIWQKSGGKAVTYLRSKRLDDWMGDYLRHELERRRRPRVEGTTHVMFALCDHYEPHWRNDDQGIALSRVETWADLYPKLADEFRDADDVKPQHSFFFPGEEYQPQYFDGIDAMVRAQTGEVELHLHHENAEREATRAEIEGYLHIYAERGHLSRDELGAYKYAFIHGNWALANGHPEGAWCGIDDEMQLLHDTGCYADFTFPSAPDACQPNVVNRIYWPVGDLSKRRAYDTIEAARVGRTYDDRLLMITGPLSLAMRENSWQPVIENGAVTADFEVNETRVADWLRRGIHVGGRPEWVFIKVYTHGAPEKQAASLLGEGGRKLHRALAAVCNNGETTKLHYVSAREMYNIAKAAIDGKVGNPNAYRDYELPPPPIRAI